MPTFFQILACNMALEAQGRHKFLKISLIRQRIGVLEARRFQPRLKCPDQTKNAQMSFWIILAPKWPLLENCQVLIQTILLP